MSQIRPMLIGLISLFCINTKAGILNHTFSGSSKLSSFGRPSPHRQHLMPAQQLVAVIPDATATATANIVIPEAAKPVVSLLESIAQLETELKTKHSPNLTLGIDDLLGAAIACAKVIDSADEVVAQLEPALPDQQQREMVQEHLGKLLNTACGDDLFALSDFLIPGHEMAFQHKLQEHFKNTTNEDVRALAGDVAFYVMETAFERISNPKKQKFATVFPTVSSDSDFMSSLFRAVRSNAGINVCDYRIPLFARLSRSTWVTHLASTVDFLSGDLQTMVNTLVNTPWQFKDLDFAELKGLEEAELRKQLRLALALEDSKKIYADRAFHSVAESAEHQLDLGPRNIARLRDSINRQLQGETAELNKNKQVVADLKAGKSANGKKVDPEALKNILSEIEAYLESLEKNLNKKIAFVEPVFKRFTDGSCDVVMKLWTATHSEIKSATFQAAVVREFQGKISSEDTVLLQQLLKALP